MKTRTLLPLLFFCVGMVAFSGCKKDQKENSVKAIATPVAPQQAPTKAPVAKKNISQVPPGPMSGCQKEVLELCQMEDRVLCLKEKLTKLSPECRTQIEMGFKRQAAILQKCQADVLKICKIPVTDVSGSFKCLMRNRAKLSATCMQQIAPMPDAKGAPQHK